MDASLIFRYFPEIKKKQIDQLEALASIYKNWNQKINVISRKDIDQLYLHHVLHSLAIAKVVRFKEGIDVLDVGTGGGFPGIPLALIYPETNFHLVDSIGKKIRVVEAVAHELGLTNVRAEQNRAENLTGNYDFIVSRAVTQLDKFMPWVRKKIKKNSHHSVKNGVLYLKGGDFKSELMGYSFSLYPVRDFFDIDYFDSKFVVHIPI